MTEITIDKRLNLVIPVEDGGSALYVHSTPIPRAVFKRYSKIFARTFNEIYGGGYGVIAGPRIAADLLESAARASNEWDGPTGVERGLLGEVYRLTNVAVPGASGGWDVVPYQIAVSTGQISEDDADEVNNALVFFTVASSMHKKTDLPEIIHASSRLWGGLSTSLNVTGYADSLKMLTAPESSGEKVITSSLPS